MLKLAFYSFVMAGLLSLAFVALPLYQQGGTIKGVLIDKTSKEAIAFASVVLYKDSLQVSTGTSNMDGEFIFKNLADGSYRILVSYVGYKKQEVKKIAVKNHRTAYVTVALSAEGVRLEEMEINVNYQRPLIDPDQKSAQTITREDYQSLPGKYKNSIAASPASGVLHESFVPSNGLDSEEYNQITDNEFRDPKKEPLSTFSIDVDKAAYSNIRRYLTKGSLPPADAVRVEEMINYFAYAYPQPKSDQPFSITSRYLGCPWNNAHRLIHVGIQGKEISTGHMPANNLVFLVDVSGSMDMPDKLPLLKAGLRLLVNQLREQDQVAIVVYAGAAGLVLPSTSGAHKDKIAAALDNLQAGGSTAGGEGILLAYQTAKQGFLAHGNNRVILATDGDFNVGVSSEAGLTQLIEKKREEDIFLTVLGFGTGNYKDSKMEQLADKGNGNYAYIDNLLEAKKVLVKEMGGTLLTIAKDVKIQVEFNPSKVKAYRLVGYENRMLNKEDFNDDKKDAGELGSGHAVTALYEIIPAGSAEPVASVDTLKYQHSAGLVPASQSSEVMTIKLRYKNPKENSSKLITDVLDSKHSAFELAPEDSRFAASVAEFGLLLRGSKFKGAASYEAILAQARAAKGKDEEGYRAEFIKLVEMAGLLENK